MSDNAYLTLIRTNRNYRRLWIGASASFLGDWFNTIALFTLVRGLTGSPLALSLVFVTKVLPFALASPLAGLLSDRFNRRRLMILTDLLRAAVVLLFVLVDEPGELPLLYLLISLQVALGAVFIPARSASIPNITSDSELVVANALSAATWSTILALGAGLGGFVTAALGVAPVFVLDSLSYCISAWFIFRTEIPQSTDPDAARSAREALRDIVLGWRHMHRHRGIGRIALAKAAWGLGGGALVYMLTLVGEGLFPAAPAVGIGLLYSARGLGTGAGPIAARVWVPQEDRWPAMLGLSIVASGLAYLGVGASPWVWWWIAALVVAGHAPSGANWVFSTVLLQRRTEDRYRGRVFATEWLLVTLADTLAVVVAGWLLESGGLGLRAALALFGGVQVLCGLLWMALVVPAERG